MRQEHQVRDLFSKVEAVLAGDPDRTLHDLAQELGVSDWVIERAIREVAGVSFRGLREGRLLALQLVTSMPPMPTNPAAGHEKQRVVRRFIVPGATVCCQVRRPGLSRPDFSMPSPLASLSRIGLAFLCDNPPKPGSRVSVLLTSAQDEVQLQLESTAVGAVPSNIPGYRYHAAVQFQPFTTGRGNSPEALEIIRKLEKTYCSETPGES